MATILRINGADFKNDNLPLLRDLVRAGLSSVIGFSMSGVMQEYGSLELKRKNNVVLHKNFATLTPDDGYIETDFKNQVGSVMVTIRVKPDITENWGYLFGMAPDDSGENKGIIGWVTSPEGSGVSGLGYTDSNELYSYLTRKNSEIPAYERNKWLTFVFSWGKDSVRYQCLSDSLNVISKSINGITTKLGPLTIGTILGLIGNDPNDAMALDFAEVIVWDRELTESEMVTQYNYSKTHLKNRGIEVV
ncbi:hypothetical protein [Vibrio parahaemolyticus]|uniref:hypothetical protein n=1 Tax=Vibrio parahaemolyticus TaxID=670 RepID=UPI00215C6A94|nr:hypothetical protein [Vibrio parahaemolyticus]MCR9713938.1 hypothetical protein [Vibrio parahaemolyticus]